MLDLKSLVKLSYGVCILSSKKDGSLNACIVNTVFQLTPEPPMVAVSVNRECLTHEYITDSKVFTVSILSQEAPMPFIGRFGFRSGRDADKFQHVKYRIGQNGAPIILDNTIAFLEAEVTETIDIASHALFIAKIVACEILAEAREPMTYAYYRDIKHGRTPKTAATYINIQPEQRNKLRS